MKYSVAFSTAVALVAAQLPASIPQCGQLCINNMLNAASAFGCSSANITCLCAEPRFGYGLRDCTNEACGSDVYAAVSSYGVSICSSAGVTAGGAGSAVATSAAGTGTGTGTGASGGNATSTAISTEALLTTITSGGSAIATSTIGSSTLYSIIGAASGAATSASGAAASAASSAASAASSAASAASSNASSALSAASSRASSATSTSSTGGAPFITAAPVLGGAALAALLMV